jgi:hypothetical protein
VRNVRDEDDLQCLAFLAGELGILHPSPFYFSRECARGIVVPQSLILRDTLNALLLNHDLSWDHGVLRLYADLQIPEGEPAGLAGGVSWFGALTPAERGIFAQATIDLHRLGISVLCHRAEMLFRRGVVRLLGGVAGAEASERRLNTVRWQLSMA